MPVVRKINTASHVPSRDELVEAARNLVPVLRDRAPRAEDLRRMPDETIADLRAAGLNKIYMPKRYGGYQMDFGVHYDISREIGRACGSTAWIASLVFSHAMFIGRFPPEAQEEFWPANPDAIVSTGSAGGGSIVEADGGYVVSGLWKFVSGIHHASVVMVLAKDDSEKPFSHMVMLYPGDYELIDTWDTEGLRGTGSHDVKVTELFVPARRVGTREEIMGNDTPGAKFHDSYLYRVRTTLYQKTWFAGPLTGTARGALESYCDITKERVGRMFRESIVGQIPVQVRVGESLAELETAEMIFENSCKFLHEKGIAGEDVVGADLLKCRRDTTFAAHLCVSATARLSAMMGAGGQHKSNPVQRHRRDCAAVATHIELNWDHTMAPTGKYLLGLETGDPLVDDPEDLLKKPKDRAAILGTQV